MGSCELPDASSSSVGTRAEQDLPAVVGMRGLIQLRAGVGGTRDGGAPPPWGHGEPCTTAWAGAAAGEGN